MSLGFAIRMLMPLQDKSALLNQYYLFMKTGLKMEYLENYKN